MGHSLQDILSRPSTDNNQGSSASWRHGTIRLYFQNVNGLRLQDSGLDIMETFSQLREIKADIFGIAETQLHCRSPSVQSIVQSCKRRIWEHCKLVSCSSDEEWPTTRKPGGTLIGVTGPLAGRVIRSDVDKYGRWTRVDLLGRDGRIVSVLCAYQVVQESGNHGDQTTYSQQVRLMRLDGNLSPDPRFQFIQDLTALVKSLKASNHDIILMGDFNESIGTNPAGMASVMTKGDLVDSFCYCHGLQQEKPTYARGRKRVDYILVSSRLISFVRATGAEPFNFRIFSDHRGLFVDFSYPGFFDRAPNELQKLHNRDLIYDCPRHVRLYLQETALYFKKHRVEERLIDLAQGSRDDAKAEALDRDITRGMLAAESTCKSTPRAPWSKALHKVLNQLFIMKRALSQKLTGLDCSAAISTMQAKLDVPITIPDTTKDIHLALRALQRTRREVIVHNKNLKSTFQQDRIQALKLASPKIDPDKIEKSFHHRQASKELYRKVPSAKPRSLSGISMIKVPVDPTADPKAPNTLFKSIADPAEVESHILQRNRTHFSQARDTPLASNDISMALGFSGTSSIADKLIKGSIDPSLITPHPFGQAILRACRRTNPQLAAGITLEEFKASYRTWRVGTSTSPSGRHLSHQHALFQPHGIDRDIEPTEHEAAENSRDANWEAQHAILSYALRYGYTFERWKQVVTAMIEKDPGNPQLHRLRVIHLYESDYNAMLGIKMRQVVHKAEDRNSINSGTYGSRANRQALDPTFLEVLQYDYACLTRWSELNFSNDATSCYDRIIPSVSNIIARSMGLHSRVAKIHGDMLEHAVYRIKTQLGISVGSYSHCVDHPVFGTGQGSCASPPFWLLNCSIYFYIYESKCYGAKYIDLDGSRELRLGMTGFVDDNKCNVNSSPQDESTLCSRAEHDAQLWSDILWSSGGALEHGKCSYRYLKTDFASSGIPYFRGGAFGTPITIHDGHGVSTVLEHKSAYDAYKTLGTYQAATKHQRAQFEALQKKATHLVRTLALSSCSAQASWIYYSSVFMKSIGFPLSASRLRKTQLQALQAPMTAITLNRLGYPKSLSRTVVFGSRRYGGLEFGHLETVQGMEKLTMLIRHLRTPGQPHDFSLIVLDRIQHNAGVGYPILEFPRPDLPYLEGVWMHTVRSYLSHISGSLRIAQARLQPLARCNDRYIMDMVIQSNLFLPRELKFLNYCRLYLQVLTLSDMLNAQGTAFAIGIYQGFRSVSQSYSTLQEPLQERPNDHTWSLWRRFLRSLSPDKCHLYECLGPWLPTLPSRRKWPNYYSPSRRMLYRLCSSIYVAHDQTGPNTFSDQYDDESDQFPFSKIFPTDAIPVDITDIDDGWYMFDPSPVQTSLPDTPKILTLSEYFSTLPEHEALLLQQWEFTGGDAFDFCAGIHSLDDVILVSDGGAIEDYASFGWVIAKADGTRLAKGFGSVFGHDPRSYRAEAHGAKAVTLFLFHCFRYCDLTLPPGLFKFYCDNQGLLNKLLYMRSYQAAVYATCLHSEWDIVSSVHRLHSRFPLLPELLHVKGHQDDNIPAAFLDLPGQLNVEADKLATHALQELGSPKPYIPFDPSTEVLLSIDGRTVTRQLGATIHAQHHLAPIRKYYKQRFLWDQSTFEAIDWDQFSAVYKKYPRHKTFFSKFGWKKLPVAGRLFKRHPSYDHRCPNCHQDHEDDDHLFRCHHESRRQWRSTLLGAITDRFGDFLDPDLLAIIRLGLGAYFQGSSPNFSSRFPTGYSSTPYKSLIDQQNAIGWDHFLRGKLSTEWSKSQYFYARRYNMLKQSEGWMYSLIRLLATSSYTLWDSRNQSRHGTDAQTKAQLLQAQTNRELHCLYLLRDQVLVQDRKIFRATLHQHLDESLQQQRTWITHYKKLIVHSVKVAKAQARLNTHQIQRFFRGNRTLRSRISLATSRHPPPRRRGITRMSNFFPTRNISKSRIQAQVSSVPIRRRSSHLTSYFPSTGISRSTLPTIFENQEATSNTIERRQLQRRSLNTTHLDLFPDHPG
jgi:zinc-binding in reverse transcriptase/Endonuclease/Exonuclease/phosphatase family